MDLMVHYFYHLTYTTSNNDSPRPTDLLDHAALFAMAVKYRIPGLCTIASKELGWALYRDNYDPTCLAQAIHTAYTSTTEEVMELRDYGC